MDSTRVWEEISKEQRRLLEGKDSGKFLGVADVSQFQTSLQAICRAYSRKHVTQILSRINPGLENVRSFTQAITACTQASGAASLVWGAGLILIEVCIPPSNQMSKNWQESDDSDATVRL